MAEHVTDPLERFRLDYAPLFLRHLSRRDESGLQAAYELGRRAMEESVGLLDVVRVHHELLLDVITTVRDTEETPVVIEAASTLLIDLIASYEVAQRGFLDGRHDASPL